jgi:hypothetical protein
MKNKKEPRPCSVKGLTGCIFLGFFEEDETLLKVDAFVKQEELKRIQRRFYETGIVSDAMRVDILHKVFAIVEMPDGTVEKVNPEDIVFLDREEGTE